MDIFIPVSNKVYPFSRAGGTPPVITGEAESGSLYRRTKWKRGAVKIAFTLKGTKTNISTDYAWVKTKGSATAFKYKDYFDYEVEDDTVGTANDDTTIFYTTQKYIDESTLVVYLDSVTVSGSEYTVSNEEGKITFDTPPVSGTLTADYEFYRKWYFNAVDTNVVYETKNLWSFGIELEEALV